MKFTTLIGDHWGNYKEAWSSVDLKKKTTYETEKENIEERKQIQNKGEKRKSKWRGKIMEQILFDWNWNLIR